MMEALEKSFPWFGFPISSSSSELLAEERINCFRYRMYNTRKGNQLRYPDLLFSAMPSYSLSSLSSASSLSSKALVISILFFPLPVSALLGFVLPFFSVWETPQRLELLHAALASFAVGVLCIGKSYQF